jgi:hypothetical protein
MKYRSSIGPDTRIDFQTLQDRSTFPKSSRSVTSKTVSQSRSLPGLLPARSSFELVINLRLQRRPPKPNVDAPETLTASFRLLLTHFAAHTHPDDFSTASIAAIRHLVLKFAGDDQEHAHRHQADRAPWRVVGRQGVRRVVRGMGDRYDLLPTRRKRLLVGAF